jgi:hypothetical protein
MGVDHDQRDGMSVDDIVLDGGDATVTWRPELLGGVAVVELDGGRRGDGALPAGYRRRGESAPATPARVTAIPYHAWANRGVRAMRVWVPLSAAGPD